MMIMSPNSQHEVNTPYSITSMDVAASTVVNRAPSEGRSMGFCSEEELIKAFFGQQQADVAEQQLRLGYPGLPEYVKGIDERVKLANKAPFEPYVFGMNHDTGLILPSQDGSVVQFDVTLSSDSKRLKGRAFCEILEISHDIIVESELVLGYFARLPGAETIEPHEDDTNYAKFYIGDEEVRQCYLSGLISDYALEAFEQLKNSDLANERLQKL